MKCILTTQDLDDVTRVYSNKHALESVLSETSIKQFLGGIRSQTTLEYLSKYLGEYSDIASSYAFAKDGTVQESISRTKRRLRTEDELRRMPTGAQIIIYQNFKAILASKVQVFAVKPWRKQLAVNSLYGKKRKLLPIEVKIGWFRTKVTERGRKRKPYTGGARPSFWACAWSYYWPRLIPSPQLVILGAIAYGVWWYGQAYFGWPGPEAFGFDW